MKLHALHQGRVRIWWITHAEDAKAAICLSLVAGLFLLTSYFDHQDALDMERAARIAAEERAERAQGFAPELPRVTFVLDARTKEDLYDRLAAIAGGLDRERSEMKGRK